MRVTCKMASGGASLPGASPSTIAISLAEPRLLGGGEGLVQPWIIVLYNPWYNAILQFVLVECSRYAILAISSTTTSGTRDL